MKLLVAVAIVSVALFSSFRHVTRTTCKKPYIFFDLGDTLIDTHTHNYDPMFTMPGALENLQALKEHHYPVGLISDVPESWGRDQEDVKNIRDYHTAKMKRLMNFIDAVYKDDHSSWQGAKFDWSYFGEFFEPKDFSKSKFRGLVVLPFETPERKKNGGRIMYQRAKLIADREMCPAIYETSDEKEIGAAREEGLIPFLVGHEMKDSYYLPVDKIDEFVRTHQ